MYAITKYMYLTNVTPFLAYPHNVHSLEYAVRYSLNYYVVCLTCILALLRAIVKQPTLTPRLQAAKLESEKLFKDISLADGVMNYTTVQQLKTSAKTADVETKSRVTRVERARREALESFGGSSLDSLHAPTNATRYLLLSYMYVCIYIYIYICV